MYGPKGVTWILLLQHKIENMMSTVALSTGSPWILLYMDLDDGSLLQLVRRLSKLGINEDDQPNFVNWIK